jgi:hypothetical protein
MLAGSSSDPFLALQTQHLRLWIVIIDVSVIDIIPIFNMPTSSPQHTDRDIASHVLQELPLILVLVRNGLNLRRLSGGEWGG